MGKAITRLTDPTIDQLSGVGGYPALATGLARFLSLLSRIERDLSVRLR